MTSLMRASSMLVKLLAENGRLLFLKTVCGKCPTCKISRVLFCRTLGDFVSFGCEWLKEMM